MPAFEGGSQCEERLAGAGGAGKGDELDVVVHQCLQGERLFGVPRADAIAGLLLDADERRIGAAVGRQRRLAAVAQHEVLVGSRRLLDRQIGCGQLATLCVEAVVHFGVDPLDRPLAGVERVEALDFVGGVVLRAEAERLGLHPQIRVLRDDDHRPRRRLLLEAERRPQDAVVGSVLQKRFVQPTVGTAPQYHADRTQPLSQRAALGGKYVAGERIEAAEKFAGLEVDVFVAALELVEFLEHRDRNRDVVLLEIADAAAVVEDDVGVEDEELGQ